MSRAAQHPAVLAVKDHLHEHAARYFPQCASGTVAVRCTRVAERRFATLADFQLTCGQLDFRVIAKLNRSEATDAFSRPATAEHARFLGTPDRAGGEASALTAYAQAVASQAGSALFAVRVLDSIHDDQVLLMERATCSPLTKLLASASRLGQARCSSPLLSVLENTGAALRTVHQMPPGSMRQCRGATREEFLAWLDVMEEFFHGDVQGHRTYVALAPRIRNAAQALLDETLPCGPQHYDFAPRNVLVDEHGRVAVIDMVDEWHGCVWEDVAHFFVSLEANKAQALSGDWFFPRGVLEELRSAFLRGYAPDGQIDDHVIRLYEAQIALTKWAAGSHQQRERRGFSKLLSRWPQSLGARCYARYAARNVAVIENTIRRVRPLANAPLVAGGVS